MPYSAPLGMSALNKGRETELPISSTHAVLGTPMKGPWPEGMEPIFNHNKLIPSPLIELHILDDCMQVYWMCFLMGLSCDYNIDDNPIHPILTLPEWFQICVNPLLNHGLEYWIES